MFGHVQRFAHCFRTRFVMAKDCLKHMLRPRFGFSDKSVADVHVCALSFGRFLRTLSSRLFRGCLSLPLSRTSSAMPRLCSRLGGICSVCERVNNCPGIIRACLGAGSIRTTRGRLIEVVHVFLGRSVQCFSSVASVDIFAGVFLDVYHVLLHRGGKLSRSDVDRRLRGLIAGGCSDGLSGTAYCHTVG